MKRTLQRLLSLTAAVLLLPSCGDHSADFFDIIVRYPGDGAAEEEIMTQKEFFDLMPSLAKNAITVNHMKSNGTAVGQSKFGGTPDLPADFTWPTYYGMGALDEEKAARPLSFMAQINLSEVHPYDTDNLLPESGMLYFFYDMETTRWGYDPDDRGCCRVYYAEADVPLISTELPEELDAMYRIPERILTFGSQVSYPTCTEIDQTYRVTWESDAHWQMYDDECIRLGMPAVDNLGMNSRLLGYPELIQNAILEECELASTGTYTGHGFPEMTDSERENLARKSEEWMLLFQMGSILDGEDEVMFGDLGSIFFCIRKADLAERNFGNVWLIFQC